jgi:2-oxoisovalerate dehydrogenase E1 component
MTTMMAAALRLSLQSAKRNRVMPCIYRHLATTNNEYVSQRAKFHKDIEDLPESRALLKIKNFVESRRIGGATLSVITPPIPPKGGYKHEMSREQVRQTLTAVLATFCLHVEARIASLIGFGFYTIGPCGEEALSSVAHSVKPIDTMALHYRHLGINLCRQLAAGESLENILLDRARGFTISTQDPVTGGVHCSIGSKSPNDYIVTSTLASQCPSAVGRALGFSLCRLNEKPVSFVTLGDGSVHNAHFWSAYSLARHAQYKRIKCPVVFGISDNGLSISYATQGYVDTLFRDDDLVPLYQVNGSDMLDVYSQTKEAVDYSRRRNAPSVVVYKNLVRRFGHAATDRQFAYLSEAEIQEMAEMDLVESTIVQAVEVCDAITYSEVSLMLKEMESTIVDAFAKASDEDKVTRQDMLDRVSAPLVKVSGVLPIVASDKDEAGETNIKMEVMRKHMTRVMAECMEKDESIVYLGEDVIHGGYYNVTENLAQKFPGRVLDFPPDETSLLGAAMGMSQIGLIPIVEIPYAKYLDCGVDMWNEICIMHWLSAGKQRNGMLLRLQGFDRGLFGGSFHTNNTLQHIPPGVDVCCYSNGKDYAKGFRHAIQQVKGGRVVMFVDCTNLLNLRHLYGKDRGWERRYPAESEMIGFDFIRRYGTEGTSAIVTYGNGVVTALHARQDLVKLGLLANEESLDIIECPCISDIPDGLREILNRYEMVLFADICKEGPGGNVLSPMICSLHQEHLLPAKWQLVSAPRTYNPLGSMVTFLNKEDIVGAFKKMTAE